MINDSEKCIPAILTSRDTAKAKQCVSCKHGRVLVTLSVWDPFGYVTRRCKTLVIKNRTHTATMRRWKCLLPDNTSCHKVTQPSCVLWLLVHQSKKRLNKTKKQKNALVDRICCVLDYMYKVNFLFKMYLSSLKTKFRTYVLLLDILRVLPCTARDFNMSQDMIET